MKFITLTFLMRGHKYKRPKKYWIFIRALEQLNTIQSTLHHEHFSLVPYICRWRISSELTSRTLAKRLRTLAKRLGTLANRPKTLANETLAKRLVGETTETKRMDLTVIFKGILCELEEGAKIIVNTSHA